MNIGFIGLGIMGKPMAKNMLKAGYDLLRERSCAIGRGRNGRRGRQGCDHIKEIGQTCDLVSPCFPTPPM